MCMPMKIYVLSVVSLSIDVRCKCSAYETRDRLRVCGKRVYEEE